MRLWKLVPSGVREWYALRQLRKGLTSAGVPKQAVEVIMGGWKTWVGGIGLIGAGLAQIAAGISNGFNMDEILKGIAMVGAGFGTIGVGHKVDKNTEAVVENTVAVVETQQKK